MDGKVFVTHKVQSKNLRLPLLLFPRLSKTYRLSSFFSSNWLAVTVLRCTVKPCLVSAEERERWSVRVLAAHGFRQGCILVVCHHIPPCSPPPLWNTVIFSTPCFSSVLVFLSPPSEDLLLEIHTLLLHKRATGNGVTQFRWIRPGQSWYLSY